MIGQDVIIIVLWWVMLLFLGISILPLSVRLFSVFFDRGYILAKVLSIAVLSYLCFFLGILHVIPFTQISLLFYVLLMTVLSYGFFFSDLRRVFSKRFFILAVVEEVFFLAVMSVWVLIRGFNPEIHGLEKYMDFGFMNSILRADFFPPKDMWMTPYPINYYYFGHLYSAVLTRLSGIPSHITYNLILGMIAGLCFITTFSLASTLLVPLLTRFKTAKAIVGGVLAGLLTTFAGNLHTIYTLFKPYENEHPVPPWQLAFSPATFPNSYWYPNATRFIYNTIHEFPIYSWVVSDLHGHVLDIPFVLLTLSLVYSLLVGGITKTSDKEKLKEQTSKSKLKTFYLRYLSNNALIVTIGFMLSVMYMTNAWDGLIYLLLACLTILCLSLRKVKKTATIKQYISYLSQQDVLFDLVSKAGIVFGSFVLFSLPFSIFFKPFVSGIGILCAPQFLTRIGRIGPFLFEVDHCQHSPWWQLLILYGFFYFFVLSFFVFLRKRVKTTSDVFVLLIILLASILIIVPEFIYAKDIYPAHYRANTMFKLVFQSFIMLSLVSGYTIVRLVGNGEVFMGNILKKFAAVCYLLITVLLLTSVFIYPYFAVLSYYNNLSTYQGIDGTTYLKNLYPTDFAAISYLNSHIKGQPVILEAQSDSYTDFARVSSTTGLPTVLGWTVHEWLWRGEYDYPEGDKRKATDKTPYYPAPRIGDVQTLYESPDMAMTKQLIKKYAIEYVFLGDLERQKYPALDTAKWSQLGKVIYESGQTRVFHINPL